MGRNPIFDKFLIIINRIIADPWGFDVRKIIDFPHLEVRLPSNSTSTHFQDLADQKIILKVRIPSRRLLPLFDLNMNRNERTHGDSNPSPRLRRPGGYPDYPMGPWTVDDSQRSYLICPCLVCDMLHHRR